MLVLLLAGACGRCEEEPRAAPEEAAPLLSVTYSAGGILHPSKQGRTGDVLVEDIRERVAPGIWEKEGVFLEIRDRTLTVNAPEDCRETMVENVPRLRELSR